MSLPLALTPGTVIGNHYIVGLLINSGGYGAVYRGVDTSEGNRPCAIKETYDVTPAARRQALIEAGVLFTVRSKHLPEIYDALEANGRFYLIMQLVEGQNLLQLLESRIGIDQLGEQEPYQRSQGPCSEQEVLAWLLPIMEVLQELHSRNPAVIHRDIKPANIILTPQQIAVLVDFGLTKLCDPNKSTQIMIKAVSAGFSPVEQYVGKTSPQSDIYSMAATMYLLLTNRLPPAAIDRSARDELIAPRLLNPSLSLKTERVLLKALAVNADQRYQSMREFAQALQEPAFSAFADPTVALTPAVSGYRGTGTYGGGYVQAQNIKQAPHAHAGVQRPQARAPQQRYPLPVPPPVPPQVPPPGYVMVPQSALVPSRPLPAPFNQGCLWGLLQGVLGALLVLFLKKEAYFYLATLMGFLFYIVAGFTTAYRGGSSLRSIWSGYWAGIISTGMFWLVLGIGLVVRATQRIQADTVAARNAGENVLPNEVSVAWRSVLPTFPNHPLLPTQPPWVNVVILLVGGLLFACCLGWFGGMLGTEQHKAKMAKRKYP